MSYQSKQGNIQIAMAGDCLISRDLSCYQEERFLALAELLRRADAAFGNLEGVVHEFEGPPGFKPGGSWTAFDPHLLDELKWMGIDIVACANDHSLDFGEWGLVATLEHLERAGLAHAGTGRNLWEAQAPAYVETAAGRIALVSVTATFLPHFRAGEQSAQLMGRPGAACLGSEKEYVVSEAALRVLRELGSGLGEEARKQRARQANVMPVPEDSDEVYHLFGNRFVKGAEMTISSRCNPRDKEAILRRVRDAARQADRVLVTIHNEENDLDPEVPPEFLQDFARACIDAGASCFIGHGHHYLQGIEIYRGLPIFYDFGNFIMELENVPRYPAHACEQFGLAPDALPSEMMAARSGNDTKHMAAHPKYWRSVVAVCEWETGRLKQARLYPVELGYGTTWSARGRPMLADRQVAGEIVETLQRLSQPFNTQIRLEDGVGIIDSIA